MKKIFLSLFVVIFSIFLISCKEETINKFTIEYAVTTGGYISGEEIQEVEMGMSTNIVKAVAEPYYHFVKWSDGKKEEKRIEENVSKDLTLTAIFEKDNYVFPSLYIDTNNVPVVSKEEYVSCQVSVDSVYEEYVISNAKAKIKGRGNSTWDFPKKPYKLKFDEKIDLFGNGKAKTWTLIANYCDQSLMRNYLAYGLGNLFSDYIYATSTQYVELYLNNEYLGLYLVCEQCEIGKNRIDISQDEDINTGYLLELDFRIYDEGATLDLDYFEVDGIPYAIKDPDTEDDFYTLEYTKYIKDYVSKAYDAVLSHDYEEVKKYLDINSFVYSYIIYELFGNVDVKFSSWYLYKDKDGLLVSSPIWDFDITAGNINYDDLALNPKFLYAQYYNKWYHHLLQIREFKELVSQALYENYYDINDYLIETVNTLKMSKDQFEKNFTKWKILGVYVWPNASEMVKIRTWEGHIDYMINWLKEKLNYMLEEYQ